MGERRKMPIRKELATIADLETGARVIPSGSDLYRQGDICSTYYVVLSGWIALSALLDDGSCQILDFALMAGRSDPSCALNSSCAIKRNLACDGTTSGLLLTTTACR